MSQMESPNSQSHQGRMQDLAQQLGKLEATLLGVGQGVEELKATMATISQERLAEARDWGAMQSKVEDLTQSKKFVITWLSGLSLVVAAAIFAKYIK